MRQELRQGSASRDDLAFALNFNVELELQQRARHNKLETRLAHCQSSKLVDVYSIGSLLTAADIMSSLSPRFFSTPVRYLRWTARERPAIFWSMAIGTLGPVMMAVVPPIRTALGDGPRPLIPLTYPGTF
jgi:hypothetical protein